MTTTTLEQRATQVRTAGGLDILAGLWLLVAPFALNYAANGGSTVNDLLVGAAIILFAGYEVVNVRNSTPSWLNVLLGAWLVAAPFVLGFTTGSAAMWNNIVTGIVVAGAALYAALSVPDTEYYES